jgi:tetratricopeptide (TPR) repeat protein
MYKRAMEGYVMLLGSHDLRTINARQNIGSSYFDMGDFAEAYKYFDEAIKSYEEHKFTGLPAYYTALTNLANVQTKMKHFDSARALFEKALHKQMHDEDLGQRHPDTIRTAFDYGEMLYIKKDYRHAVQYFDQALKGCQLTGIEDNQMTADALKRIQACIDFGHIEDF